LQHIGPKIKEWLEDSDSGNWILILDNANNKADFFPETNADQSHFASGFSEYPPHRRTGTTTVITSQDHEVGYVCATTASC
jgi:hypothetical protein